MNFLVVVRNFVTKNGAAKPKKIQNASPPSHDFMPRLRALNPREKRPCSRSSSRCLSVLPENSSGKNGEMRGPGLSRPAPFAAQKPRQACAVNPKPPQRSGGFGRAGYPPPKGSQKPVSEPPSAGKQGPQGGPERPAGPENGGGGNPEPGKRTPKNDPHSSDVSR